jgi:hypothetical protein
VLGSLPVGTTIRIVGKVDGIRDEENITLMEITASDGVKVTVEKDPNTKKNHTQYVEVVGVVLGEGRIQDVLTIDFGNNFSLFIPIISYYFFFFFLLFIFVKI